MYIANFGVEEFCIYVGNIQESVSKTPLISVGCSVCPFLLTQLVRIYRYIQGSSDDLVATTSIPIPSNILMKLCLLLHTEAVFM